MSTQTKPLNKFITFEGGDGSGKSTLAKWTADWMSENLGETIYTREPGGTPTAEEIRAILLDGKRKNLPKSAELLLFFAARADLVANQILPAICENNFVVCDRFIDSTLAYQGGGRNWPREYLESLCQIIDIPMPQITFLLDVDTDTGLKRSKSRLAAEGSSEDRFENEEINFHWKVRYAYLDLAKEFPYRIKVLDSTNHSLEELFEQVKSHLLELYEF